MSWGWSPSPGKQGPCWGIGWEVTQRLGQDVKGESFLLIHRVVLDTLGLGQKNNAPKVHDTEQFLIHVLHQILGKCSSKGSSIQIKPERERHRDTETPGTKANKTEMERKQSLRGSRSKQIRSNPLAILSKCRQRPTFYQIPQMTNVREIHIVTRPTKKPTLSRSFEMLLPYPSSLATHELSQAILYKYVEKSSLRFQDKIYLPLPSFFFSLRFTVITHCLTSKILFA